MSLKRIISLLGVATVLFNSANKKTFLLFGTLGIWFCTGVSAAPVDVTILPPGEGCTHQGDEQNQVHVERFHWSSRETSVTLAVPTRLAADFETIEPPLTAMRWCVKEIERRYTTGDENAVFDSALLKLLGVGSAQELDEAKERLLAVEGDDQRQAENALMNLVRMYSEKGVLQDELGAAQLIYELVKRGNEEAQQWTSRAIWTFNNREDFDQALALARVDFERESSPVTSIQLGEALLARGDSEEAFQVATNALQAGTSDAMQELILRDLRVQSALKSMRLSKLDTEDISHFRSLLGSRGILQRVIVVVIFTVPLVILTLFTRRRKATTPGWLLTSSWVQTMMVGAGIGLMMNMQIPVGIAMTTCMLLAIAGPMSLNYFSRAETPWLAQIGWVVAGFVVATGCSYAYDAGYDWITGAPPESQLVALLLSSETSIQLACALFLGGLCIPLVEEICFRGFLFDWLGKRMTVVWVVLFSSVLFGLLHGITFAIPTGVIGAIACLLRIRFKNLWGAFALHTLNNSLAISSLYFGWE